MPRTLTLRHTRVAPEQRAAYLDRVRAWRDYYRGAACRYWVFEEAGGEGSFIEFIEAADAATLEAALAGAPHPVAADHIYRELEFV